MKNTRGVDYWHKLWLCWLYTTCQGSLSNGINYKRALDRFGNGLKWDIPRIRWMCISICAIRLCRRLWLHLLWWAKSFVFYIRVIVGYQLIIIDCCTECVTVVRCRFEIVHCTCWYPFWFRQIGCLFTVTCAHSNVNQLVSVVCTCTHKTFN